MTDDTPRSGQRPGALIIARSDEARLNAERETITQVLKDLREDLEATTARLRDGETVKAPEVKGLLTDMRYWLRALRETEAELDTIIRNEAGITGSYGLDLEIAGAEIGCRLARLRECCREGELSE